MMIFLILAPYAAFTLLMLAGSPLPSLFTAAVICLMVIGYDVFRGRAVKLLGAGSAILFASLGGYVILIDPGLSPSAVKLAVDCGMLAIALLSLAIRRPFTLQYALEVVDAQTAGLLGFLTANYIITAVWSAAFLLMLMANALMIYLPGLRSGRDWQSPSLPATPRFISPDGTRDTGAQNSQAPPPRRPAADERFEVQRSRVAAKPEIQRNLRTRR